MDCVYQAFTHNMKAIGEPDYAGVWDEYKRFKTLSHGGNFHQLTFAGVLPLLYWQMLYHHNLRSVNRIEMMLQRTYIEIAEYIQEGTHLQRELMMKTSFWGLEVEQITLKPAIYCLLNEQHAQFGHEIPDWKGARIIMAFQLKVIKDKEE